MVLHICKNSYTLLLKVHEREKQSRWTQVYFFKALADDTRPRCLLLITQSTELCVCELMEALNETQPKISRHLAQLRKRGLLSDRRQGQWVLFYKLHPDPPE